MALEWLKVLIPTVGAIIVFITWRSGKVTDLLSEYYRFYGETSAEIFGQIEYINRELRGAEYYHEEFDRIVNDFKIAPKHHKYIRDTYQHAKAGLTFHLERLVNWDSELDALKRKVEPALWQPISLRILGNCIGKTIAINARIMKDKQRIEELEDVLKLENLFNEVFRNTDLPDPT